MHVLFLTDNFPPEVNAPASRTFEHCREWVKVGHKVTVITCAPNFPKGKLFDGYRNLPWQRSSIEGIDVIRVWSYITANEGFLRRTLDYASFMCTAFPASLFVRNVDVIVATSPQLFAPCAAYLAGLFRRRPYVFELRDLWPESIRAVGAIKDSRVLDALEGLELFLYRRASHVVSVTEAFRDNLVTRGISGDKISVVTNGADLARFVPRRRDEALARQLELSGSTVVGYVGTHGMAHHLSTVLGAAELASRDPRLSDVRFLLLGDGAEKAALKAQASSMALGNVTFIDSVPRDEVVRYWSIIDLAVIHLKRTPLFKTVIPSKLFECMAMGIPVLHGVEGESADIVAREGVGIVFEPENARQLCAAIERMRSEPRLLEQCRRNGVAAAARYDRQTLAGKMLDQLQHVATPPAT
jgi:glycosyltransferase involved in cell wall biosynthesis